MADVRSLLRQEQAKRRAEGEAQSKAANLAPSRKRKAAEDDEARKKKAKSAVKDDIPSTAVQEEDVIDREASSLPISRTDSPGNGNLPLRSPSDQGIPSHSDAPASVLSPPKAPSSTTSHPLPVVDEVDEDEWAAFEREVVTPPERPAISTWSGSATIEAKPISAAELAAQAREEQSIQRGRKDNEIEEEREDAARQLDDEMEEMEGLEERMRKLKEKREALRRAKQDVVQEDPDEAINTVVAQANAVDASEDEDEDEDDFDEWGTWVRRGP